MKSKLKFIWEFLVDVINKFIDDKCPKLGAALSFYTIFSLAPLLIIAISVAGLIFGEKAASGQIVGEIKDMVGNESAVLIQNALRKVSFSSANIIAIIMSLVTMIIGSTVVFVELQDSLDMIWKVKPKPGGNFLKSLLKDRIKSFVIVIGTGFLLLVSLMVSSVISALSSFINEKLISLPVLLLDSVDIIISLAIIFVLFGMIFKGLPDVELEWRHVWIGSIVTAVLFVMGKYLIGLYIGQSTLGSTYGAASSLVILLLWVYYSAQILFIGAEFTQVYAERLGEGIKPSKNFMKYHDETLVLELPDIIKTNKKAN